MHLSVRPAAASDLPFFHEICLKTGFYGEDATSLCGDHLILGELYAAPYLFHDIDLCFVALQDGTPAGYCVGSADTLDFARWMESSWLPAIRARYQERQTPERRASDFERKVFRSLAARPEGFDPELRPWLAAYPAHLHVDLLPALQGKGFAKALVDAFCRELRSRDCPGVHLDVSARNPRAIRFYEKMGFAVLVHGDGGLLMGKKT